MFVYGNMQLVNALDWRALMQALAAWIARLAGLDVLPPGCRPVPVVHLDFDPALAKRLGSTNYAVAYAVIYGWIKSNERNGKARYQRGGRWYTKGSDTAFANLYAPCMTRPTWARAVDKLAAAGLIVATEIDGVQAYALGVQAPVHGVQAPVHGEHPPVHREHYKNEDSKTGIQTPELNTPAAIPARAAAGSAKPNREGIDEVDKDGQDELMALIHSREVVAPPGWPPTMPPLPAEFPPPPVAPPPSPDEPVTTEIDEPTEDGDDTREADAETAELRAIWPGMAETELRRLRERYGMAAIRGQWEAVANLPNVRNAPGLTLHRLKVGVHEVRPNTQRGYTDGAYAGFIES